MPNYCYLHSNDQFSVGRKGLGFGGDLQQFRLWVDAGDMERRSYTNAEDNTYVKGHLMSADIQTPTLTSVEVWGINKYQEQMQKKLQSEQAMSEIHNLQN